VGEFLSKNVRGTKLRNQLSIGGLVLF